MIRDTILAYVKAVGPSAVAHIAADLGVPVRKVQKAASCMARRGLLVRQGEKPLLFAFGRDPMPMDERLKLAREAGESHREAIRLTPEQRRARDRLKHQRHREANNAARRERRMRQAEREGVVRRKPGPKPKPKAVPLVKRMDEARPLPSALVRPQAPVYDADAVAAFMAANPDKVERLPIDAPWRSFDKPRLTDRERRLLMGPALKRVAG